MTAQAKRELKLTPEQQELMLAEIPNAESFYNRISIEHEIPLAVAEAMVRFAGVFTCQMIQSRADTSAMSGLTNTYGAMWMGMAKHLNIPEPRMVSALKDAIDASLTIAKKSQEALARFAQRQSKEAAVAA